MKVVLQAVTLALVIGGIVAGPAAGQEAMRIARVRGPVRVSAPKVEYPDQLKQERIQGTVIVEARVDTTGVVDPESIAIVESPDIRFNDQARDFVLKSRFAPARADGKKIPMYVRVPVVFDLRGWR